MKTFKTNAAQGDIYIRKIAELPSGTVPVKAENGRHVIAHSETGHDHVMEAEGVTLHRLPDSIMDCFLIVSKPTALKHLRPFDTHEPIKFEKGVYHVKRQRENSPEGWRRVED